MAEFHPLPTGPPQESAQWIEWNQEAAERARYFDLDVSAVHQPQGNNNNIRRRISVQPFLQHLTYRDYDHIYEPAEDTYLLLDALQYEVEQNQILIIGQERMQLCLEVGCGTGVVSAALQSLLLQLRPRDVSSVLGLVFATDVNPHAVASAQTLGVNTVLCDLAAAFRTPIDILIFNPPYVPTPNDEIQGNGLEVSWAGGTNGRLVIDRWVKETLVTMLARPHGIAYLVTVDDNHPEQLADHLWTTHNLILRPLFRRRAKNEFLTVQKITWRTEP